MAPKEKKAPKAKKPPKTKKAGSPEKKKKLSRIERLRQQQEEEERKLKEEEEARLKAEREAAEKLEKQQAKARKWQALIEKAESRKNDELEELYLLEKCFLDAEKTKKEVRVFSKWKHYIECDGTPDPCITQEINTYISLWKEKTNEDIDTVMKESKLVLSLIEKLELALLDTPPHELTYKQIEQYQGSILELRELLHFKFSEATETLLKEASSLVDTDSGNMEKIIKDENITLYVWANLKKNPKYKRIKFGDTGVGFEIPKALATSDIAVRIFHTNYDHVSPLPMIPRLAKSEITDVIIEDSAEKETAKDEEVPQAGLEEVAENQELMTSSIFEMDMTKTESSLVNSKKSMISVKDYAEVKKDEIELKSLRSDTYSLSLLAPATKISVPDSIYEIVNDEDIVDLKGFMPLGGIYHLNILKLPPQSKHVKGWTIVELLSGGLQPFVYPPEIIEETTETENPYPPIEIFIEIKKNVVFFEKPMVARWDSQGKGWRTDGFFSLYYDMTERTISFSLESVFPVTLIQDIHVHMPFESWELKPISLNEAVLNITTAYTDIDIQIKDNQCMLASVELGDEYELSHLLGKWMNITNLIIAMKDTGFNIFPSEHSHIYVAVNYKDPLVEMKSYRQMALMASAYSFGWSKWNKYSGPGKVVIKASELLEKKYVADNKWSLFMFDGERAQKLKINEFSEEFSEELDDNTEFHSTLYHMIKDFTSEAALKKIRDTDYLFIDVVCKLLLSTRLLTFS
ncbi:protein CASC1 isoform X1 [Sarcophilus harrisii]|uniref:Dynein axonemal intermediate chain 7 n=1 Tax=Sarcophilus harrisii TaxID=9305 RepID=G3VSF7_SARHA|nr:protein CASC1 isoform X1 [Sarcophilus harrisii]